MLKLVIYDIEDDKVRTKLAKLLEKEGLERLQYSVFVGEFDHFVWQRIQATIEHYCNKHIKESDKVYSMIISEKQFLEMIAYGEKPEVDYICNRLNSLYLGDEEVA